MAIPVMWCPSQSSALRLNTSDLDSHIKLTESRSQISKQDSDSLIQSSEPFYNIPLRKGWKERQSEPNSASSPSHLCVGRFLSAGLLDGETTIRQHNSSSRSNIPHFSLPRDLLEVVMGWVLVNPKGTLSLTS